MRIVYRLMPLCAAALLACSSALPLPLFAQNDISISAETAGQGEPDGEIPVVVPRLPAFSARIVLLLPLQSEALGPAAQAVRAGFMTAARQDPDGAALIDTVETGETAQEILAAYQSVVTQYDIVVGPLSRSGAAAIAQQGKGLKPTIALTQPEIQEDVEIALPPKMIAIGLSAEDDARQVAGMASRAPGRALVVAGPAAWQRRAAKAFALRVQKLGREVEVLELSTTGAYLAANGLIMLKRMVVAEPPAMIFAALDAGQTRQMRMLLNPDAPPVYGTSQLNPHAPEDWAAAERMPEMNGTRLVDMPWMLQPDHPAVMIFPRMTLPAEQKRNADLDRLYALGIDAYRIAREIALGQTQFQLDGVTGKLAVKLQRDKGRFERSAVPAIYREGMPVPLPVQEPR